LFAILLVLSLVGSLKVLEFLAFKIFKVFIGSSSGIYCMICGFLRFFANGKVVLLRVYILPDVCLDSSSPDHLDPLSPVRRSCEDDLCGRKL
jgi:hypothetical protein